MDLKLKRRLTGAVILVSLAVIFVPVILEGPDNEWTPLTHRIPEAPRLEYKAPVNLSQEVEIPAPVARSREIPAPATPAEDSPAPVSRSVEIPQKPLYKPAEPVREKPVEVSAQPPETSRPAESAGFYDGWYVQVGSFGVEQNARGLVNKLASGGHDVSYQERATSSGSIYRVLVGPRESREQAQLLRERLAGEFRLQGIVINNPG